MAVDYDKLFSDYLAAFRRANPRAKREPSLEVWDSRTGWVRVANYGPPFRVRPSEIRRMTERLASR